MDAGRRSTDDRASRPSDATLLAGLGVVLLLWFLAPFVVHALRFPLGPDTPVYLWWTRLAGLDGLSAVERPGVPALALALVGATHLSLTAALVALECVLGTAVGLGSAALARRADPRPAVWLGAGALAGAFAVHLASGYLANLAFTALFVAAAVALAEGCRRAAIGAAAVLVAGGLCHPMFFLLGAAILLGAALLGWRGDRADATRVVASVVGAGVGLGLALLWCLVGPSPVRVDTSRDAFLRRAGLGDVLRSAYLDRLVHRWTRYVQWASVPLAALGLTRPTGFVRRVLWAWAGATVLGVAVGAATGWFPPDRSITFGFAIPILAASGLARIWSWLSRRRVLALLVTVALGVAMLAGAAIAWWRQEPFLSPLEVARATTAGAVAEAAGPGALVFTVDGGDGPTSFLATRAGNVVRAAVPPPRIRDVVISVPPPDGSADAERRALTQLTAADVARAARGRASVRFVLAPFDRPGLARADLHEVSRGVFVAEAIGRRLPPPTDPLVPTSPAGIVVATLLVAALALAVGWGWTRAAGLRGARALGVAAPVGMAALVLVATILERLGLPLIGSVGPTVVSAVAAAGGYLAWLVLERRVRARPSHEV